MDIAVLMNQVIIMKSLLTLVTDPELISQLKHQIMFTESRIKGMS